MQETNKLDPEFKAKWIEALRSGKYAKGECQLKQKVEGEDFYRYCCLGVAGEVLGIENMEGWGMLSRSKEIWPLGPEALNGNVEGIPKILLSNIEGTVKDNPVAWKLAGINDNSTSFEPVIQYIEENL